MLVEIIFQNQPPQQGLSFTVSLGGIATVGLGILYYFLYRETQEQTQATRASYAPSLDVEVDKYSNYIDLDITNNGEGTAKNIEITMEIVGDYGEFGYTSNIDKSLKPRRSVVYPKPRHSSGGPLKFKFEPEFRTEAPKTRFQRLRRKLPSRISDKSVTWINTCDFDQAISEFPERYVKVKLSIRYSDITGDRYYTNQVWEHMWADSEESGIDSSTSEHLAMVAHLESSKEGYLSKMWSLIKSEYVSVHWSESVEVSID